MKEGGTLIGYADGKHPLNAGLDRNFNVSGVKGLIESKALPGFSRDAIFLTYSPLCGASSSKNKNYLVKLTFVKTK